MSDTAAGSDRQAALSGRKVEEEGVATPACCGMTACAAQALQAATTHMAGSPQPAAQQGEGGRAAAAPYCSTTKRAMKMASRRRMAGL